MHLLLSQILIHLRGRKVFLNNDERNPACIGSEGILWWGDEQKHEKLEEEKLGRKKTVHDSF